MASDHGNGPPAEVTHGDYPGEYPGADSGYGDKNWQNGGSKTPDSLYRLKPTSSVPTNPLPPPAGWTEEPRQGNERNRSRQRNGRSASGQTRTCKKCGLQLTGQFDCGEIVASKFFPAEGENGEGQYPLCETDYFRRLGLLCHQCGGALRGSYITALERKYHVDHFTCSLCTTVFGAQDSYYEHDGNVYCHYHYSTQFAQRCNGCQTAILKQFVEIFRNGQDQHWHPECYMIHKFWNVRLAQPIENPENSDDPSETAVDVVDKDFIRQKEEQMEDKVYRIWSVLSTFEESSAACISDMLLHVSNAAYVDGVLVAKRFIWHVEILFQSADKLDQAVVGHNGKGMSYGREAKLLCKKIVAFFSLLSKTQEGGTRALGVTQELLSLVTGLAHYLKLLIRICLQGALRLERESNSSDGLHQFLDDLNDFETSNNEEGLLQVTMGGMRLSAKDSDHCALCGRSVEDECAKSGDMRLHLACVNCSRCGREMGRTLDMARYDAAERKVACTTCLGGNTDGFSTFDHISKLQQYVFLLKVALARLLDILRNGGAISSSGEDSNGYAASERNLLDPPRLTLETRSRSYAGGSDRDHHRESTYENTLNEVRRLRSTRLDRHLSSSVRQARTSRVLDADIGAPRPASSGGEDTSRGPQGSTDQMFGQNDAITLDDISRIVAVEQSREQQHQRDRAPHHDPFRSPIAERSFSTGHIRAQSAGRDQDLRSGDAMSTRMGRKFFPELSGLEYFNVRHLAVLIMHPMVEQEFTLEELLGFIESKKQTFWKNLGKAFKNDKGKGVKKKGVFGVPLEVIIERDGADSTDGVGPGTLRIPAVVDDIIASMRKMDLSVEGVFRKNGNIKKQQAMVDQINAEGCDTVNFMEQPVVQLAAVLKRYLRDLPDPLMTHKLYGLWLSCAKIQDPAKRLQCLHMTCCLLPKSHRDCLEILLTFLKWAGSFHQLDEEVGSKMDIRNLATVIAPNILTNTAKAPALDSEAIYVIDAVEMLINNIEEMCQVPEDILNLLNDPYLFNSNGDISTKEILKRYQDRGGQPSTHEVTGVYNRQDNPSHSPPKRGETDPSVWQGERSVRPMQDPPIPYANSGQSTPPQRFRAPEDQPSPYTASQFTHSDSHLEGSDPNQRGEWRNSGWGRHPGGLGVGDNF
ncbi:Rho-type GTPase-activating protein 1 [Cladobotryum mycophilum]|uniref:Rho-type GTPase-activating protein 1 n=1 Tax=Cladobotryum mycophilum TaxID=491253 RepID=A0ABR0S6A1_9HYPO